uniref:Protein translocase subunit SecA n=1 Tax=Lygus hesperus TaxID=30085 RepID=A0A0A9WEW9_LYGHE
MLARGVLQRHVGLFTPSSEKFLPDIFHNLNVAKHPDSAYHTSQFDSFPFEFTTKKKQTKTGAFPISVSSDLGRLLSIDRRYELYHFLRRFTITKAFYDEIRHIFYVQNLQTDFPRILNLIDMYSWNSGMDGLLMMKSCAETWHPVQYQYNGGLLPHQTLCENMDKPVIALSKLLDKASSNVWPKAVVLSQIELLMNKIISSGSQCTIDKVNSFLVSNYCTELKGPVLCSSWVSFYLSPYEHDLKIAANILENNEHVMMPYMDRTLSQVAEYLLDEKQLNRYYVLLQVFSKRSRQKKMENLLELLFDHFYNANNFRGCLSCVALARELKLKLAAGLLFKFEVMQKGRRLQKDMTFVF